jgi:hypothetical protein
MLVADVGHTRTPGACSVSRQRRTEEPSLAACGPRYFEEDAHKRMDTAKRGWRHHLSLSWPGLAAANWYLPPTSSRGKHIAMGRCHFATQIRVRHDSGSSSLLWATPHRMQRGAKDEWGLGRGEDRRVHKSSSLMTCSAAPPRPLSMNGNPATKTFRRCARAHS